VPDIIKLEHIKGNMIRESYQAISNAALYSKKPMDAVKRSMAAPDRVPFTNLQRPVRLFFSYCHKDERWKDELAKHLSIMTQQGLIAPWHDRKISPGAEWEAEIESNINNADVILLLVSANFLDSKFCRE